MRQNRFCLCAFAAAVTVMGLPSVNGLAQTATPPTAPAPATTQPNPATPPQQTILNQGRYPDVTKIPDLNRHGNIFFEDYLSMSIGNATVGPWNVGSRVEFQFKPYNFGPLTVDGNSGIAVTGTVSNNFINVSVLRTPYWNCSVAGLTFSCSYRGRSVAPKNTLPPITVSATANVVGDAKSCAWISATGFVNTAPANQPGCFGEQIAVLVKADVGIVKSGGGTAHVGDTVAFVLAPFNHGPAAIDASTSITVTDFFSNLFVTSAPDWRCAGDSTGSSVYCTYTGGRIPPGSPMPTITVRTVARTSGAYSNCADIRAFKAEDDNWSNNRSCVRGTILP